MAKHSPQLIEITPIAPDNIYDSLGLNLASDRAASDENGNEDALLAYLHDEVNSSIPGTLPDDGTINLTGSILNAARYSHAEHALSRKMTRSRRAAILLGLISAASFAKSAQNLHEAEYSIFLEPAPAGFSDVSIQDCFDNPAQTILHIDDTQESDAASEITPSTSECLFLLANEIRIDLREKRTESTIRPLASDTEQLLTDLDELSQQPGENAPQPLVDAHERIGEVFVRAYEEKAEVHKNILFWSIIGFVSGMTAMVQEHDRRIRTLAFRLLQALKYYDYDSVRASLDAATHADIGQKHQLTETTGKAVHAEYFPLDASSAKKSDRVHRAYALSELSRSFK